MDRQKTTDPTDPTGSSNPVITATDTCQDLLALLKHMKSTMADIAEAYGLTPIQLYALHAIKGDSALTISSVVDSGVSREPAADMTMGKLAQTLRCDASNVTGIVDRLVALELISRNEHAQDRRVKVLQLTSKGSRAIKSIQAELPAALGCDRLDATDRCALRPLVGKLQSARTD